MIAGLLLDSGILFFIAAVLTFVGITLWMRLHRLPQSVDRREQNRIRLESKRKSAVRLPTAADSGKIDPPTTESPRIDRSIEVGGARTQNFSHDRRVTREEMTEITPEQNDLWTRIGARRRGASIPSDDKPVGGSSWSTE
jgi:hypothetical protein